MASDYSDTDLVFGDLRHVAAELAVETSSPVRVRRLLSQFITLSQQLTEIMRKEYGAATGERLEARRFPSWTPVTELFKRLRRCDYHRYPITIVVRETQYFAVGDIFEDDVGGAEVAFEGTWDLGNPFAQDVPDGIRLLRADPATGKKTDEAVDPVRRSYVFVLRPRTPELAAALTKAGDDDVHTLVAECFATLEAYAGWYKAMLEQVRRPASG